MQDLNMLLHPSAEGWMLYDAYGINNTGQVAGTGINPAGEPRAFLLTPVPELPGDYNSGGTVEQADLDLVLLHWGEVLFNPYAAGWINDLPTGTIDQDELDKVLLGWGNSVEALGAAGVPEPSALSVALIVTCLTCYLCRSSGPLRSRRPAG